MKTAISIPDDLFHEADYLAKQQGLKRSQFYVMAIRAFVRMLRKGSITAQLDKVYADSDSDDHASYDRQVEHAALADVSSNEW